MLERIEAGRIAESRLMETVFPEEATHHCEFFCGQARLAIVKGKSSRIIETGRTSPTLEVEHHGEDRLTGGERALCARGWIALDAGGRPTGVPSLAVRKPPYAETT